jgi:hypothetical protein
MPENRSQGLTRQVETAAFIAKNVTPSADPRELPG